MVQPWKCHTCKHYRQDNFTEQHSLENRTGECAIRVGDNDRICINLDSGTYGNGCWIESVTVDALFGCAAWEEG